MIASAFPDTILLVAAFVAASVAGFWLWNNKVLNKALRILGSVAVALVICLVLVFVSTVNVGDGELGLVVKKFGGGALPTGKIMAVAGENGPQAAILGPGFHFLIWPWQYDVHLEPITEIPDGQVGLVTATDGEALAQGEIYAPEWPDRGEMIDPIHFLTQGGKRGPQATVLTPGKYRLNPMLFKVELQDVTNIQVGHVGVIKSNIGPMEHKATDGLVEMGERGIWREPLKPQKYYIHRGVFEVTDIQTLKVKISYSGEDGSEYINQGEIRLAPIIVLSKDGFEFPVDVRVIYHIEENNAPLVVSTVGDDDMILGKVLTPAVRSVFRDNAEQANALDYVKQRSIQQQKSKEMLTIKLALYGITVDEVLIGRVGDRETLGLLLQTQTDREIAIQQQTTLVQQQKAAEEKKNLTKTQQEAEEERKLATAEYEVKIAQQAKERRIIDAQADAEQVKIAALADAERVKIAAEAEAQKIARIGEAQAEAFRVIAASVGPERAALLELMSTVAKNSIRITPEVMVGAGGSTGDALMGTMLRGMINTRQEPR